MSRTLKRVPMDFSWPLKRVWRGYLNPYDRLSKDCEACDRSGYSPQAQLFHDQWYGKAPFDPIAYGCSRVLTVDHPLVQATARNNVQRAPAFYMTAKERRDELVNWRNAGVDLPEVNGTLGSQGAGCLGAKCDECGTLISEHIDIVCENGRCSECEHPIQEHFGVDDAPLVPIGGHRASAIQREAHRLLVECFRNHWSHNLIQADVDALIEADRLWDFTRTPRDAGQEFVVSIRMAFHNTNSWLPESNGYHPTAEEVNDWSMHGLGHGGSNLSVIMRARCKREGVTLECARCGGHGHYWQDVTYDDLSHLTAGLLSPQDLFSIAAGLAIAEHVDPPDDPYKPTVVTKVPAILLERLSEEWESYDPPAGDGYQLWENSSEGSPVTPVFATLEELCVHAEDHCTTFGSEKATKEKWYEMLVDDFVHHVEGNNVFL